VSPQPACLGVNVLVNCNAVGSYVVGNPPRCLGGSLCFHTNDVPVLGRAVVGADRVACPSINTRGSTEIELVSSVVELDLVPALTVDPSTPTSCSNRLSDLVPTGVGVEVSSASIVGSPTSGVDMLVPTTLPGFLSGNDWAISVPEVAPTP
jgi:hypothetical protein